MGIAGLVVWHFALYLADEPISALGQRFNVAGHVGFVAERLAKFLDGGVETVVEINKCVGGPQALTQFVARHQLPALLQQDLEDLDGLALQPQPDAISAQLPAMRIEFERAETERLLPAHGHDAPPWEDAKYTPQRMGRSVILSGVASCRQAIGVH